MFFRKILKSNLFKTSSLNGIANLIRVSISLITNKIVAINLGPAGVALMGQFLNFTSFVQGFATSGINNGIIKYIAENREDIKKRDDYIVTSLHILCLMSLILSLLVIIFYKSICLYVMKSEEYAVVFLIFACTLFFFTLNGWFTSLLNGFKEIVKLAFVNILSSVFGLLIAIVLIIKYKLMGALSGIILSQSLVFIIALVIVVKSKWFRISILLQKGSMDAFKKLFKYAIMGYTYLCTTLLTQFLIRSYLMKNLSIDSAGFWQGITKVSDIYITFITMTLSVYYLPRLSEIKDKYELRHEIIKGYKFILPITILTSIAIYMLRFQIIRILFSPAFFPMASLFLFYTVGNVIKIASWLLSYLMFAKAMTKRFIYTETFFAVINYSFMVFFVSRYSLQGAAISYLVCYCIYFVLILYLFKSTLWFKRIKK